MRKTIIKCDFCGCDIDKGHRVCDMTIVGGKGRRGAHQLDMCEGCHTAFIDMVKKLKEKK